MKLLVKHLEKFLNKKIKPMKIEEALIKLGVEVEQSHIYDFDNIIVVKIIDISPHPNADKLKIVTVNDSKNDIKIVCGADNIKIDQKVPLAKINTTLDQIVISRANIRGVQSDGMLCSEKELNISTEGSGIMILDSRFNLGEELSNYYIDTSWFDVTITPNRPDWYSALGIARELGAYFNNKINKLEKVNKIPKNIYFQDKTLGDNYLLIKIEGADKFPVDEEILRDLKIFGINPKNNFIIDFTNWATFLYGQPMHAFDADKIKGDIFVRYAKDKEQIILIDGTKLKLSKSDIVVADEKEAIALAGIMGGKNTACTNSTKNVYLELASFNHQLIRKSVVDHKLNSEASIRFEKGIDPNLPIDIAKDVINTLSRNNHIKISLKGCEHKKEIKKINFDKKYVKKICNLDISNDEIDKILQNLGYINTSNNQYIVPSWRFDISREDNAQAEIAEDILRIYGLENVKIEKLSNIQKSINKDNFFQKLNLKTRLIENGFNETMSMSFGLKEDNIVFYPSKANSFLKVKNPLSKEMEFLRFTLLSGLFKTVRQNPSFHTHQIFEIGTIFTNNNKSIEKIAALFTGDKLDKVKKMLTQLKLNVEIKKASDDILNHFDIKIKNLFYFETKISELKNLKSKNIKLNKNLKFVDYGKFSATVKDVSFWISPKYQEATILKEISHLDDRIIVVEKFDRYIDLKTNKTALGVRIILDQKDKPFKEKDISNILNKVYNYLKVNKMDIR